jgi:hypothetical protein
MEQTYEAPAIEERTEITAPLNIVTTGSNPNGERTPTWRRPESD